jgi:hypothetical protein
MIRKSISHYGSDYFNNYQKKIGEIGGVLNKFKFQKHISKTHFKNTFQKQILF